MEYIGNPPQWCLTSFCITSESIHICRLLFLSTHSHIIITLSNRGHRTLNEIFVEKCVVVSFSWTQKKRKTHASIFTFRGIIQNWWYDAPSLQVWWMEWTMCHRWFFPVFYFCIPHKLLRKMGPNAFVGRFRLTHTYALTLTDTQPQYRFIEIKINSPKLHMWRW